MSPLGEAKSNIRDILTRFSGGNDGFFVRVSRDPEWDIVSDFPRRQAASAAIEALEARYALQLAGDLLFCRLRADDLAAYQHFLEDTPRKAPILPTEDEALAQRLLHFPRHQPIDGGLLRLLLRAEALNSPAQEIHDALRRRIAEAQRLRKPGNSLYAAGKWMLR